VFVIEDSVLDISLDADTSDEELVKIIEVEVCDDVDDLEDSLFDDKLEMDDGLESVVSVEELIELDDKLLSDDPDEFVLSVLIEVIDREEDVVKSFDDKLEDEDFEEDDTDSVWLDENDEEVLSV
jgi:hypothetical protein